MSRDQGGSYKVRKAMTTGGEAGQHCRFFPESGRLDQEPGSSWERGHEAEKGVKVESGKAGKNNSAISRNGDVVRKSNFKEEDDELGHDFIYLTNTRGTRTTSLALY